MKKQRLFSLFLALLLLTQLLTMPAWATQEESPEEISEVQSEETAEAVPAAEEIPEPDTAPQLELNCKGAMLVELNSDSVLYELNADERLYPASLTKIMTCLVALERGSDRIILAGIDDPNGYADQKSPETLAAEVYAAHGDPFWMLLAHRNNLFERRYSLLGADLVFSGHAHGGQFRLPLVGGLIAPGQGFFPKYDSGLYTKKNTSMVVSRGIGNSIFPFRFNNRPEIILVKLTASN